jgi:predicted dehydrogenase
MKPLQIAIAGLGRMGRFHAAALAGSPAVEVVAVAEPAAASITAAGDSIGGAAVYTTPEEAFAHPGVEACLIATPTPTHPAVVRAAFAAGLNVLCEKPLSLDPAESHALGAERGELLLQVGFWRRFSPPWQAAANAIRAGRIGRPLMVRLSQWDAAPPPPEFCDPAVSGGLAIDCGVHEFDLAEWMTGLTIESVQAWTLPTVDAGVVAAGDIDNLVVALQLEGGALATVDLSRNSRYGDDVRTEILGSEGAILIDLLPTGRARIGTTPGMETLAGSETADATAAGVIGQMEAFAAAIRGEPGELPGAANSARATEIAIAATAAARSGDVISVAP